MHQEKIPLDQDLFTLTVTTHRLIRENQILQCLQQLPQFFHQQRVEPLHQQQVAEHIHQQPQVHQVQLHHLVLVLDTVIND